MISSSDNAFDIRNEIMQDIMQIHVNLETERWG